MILSVADLFGQPNDPPRRIWFSEAPRINLDERSQYFYDFTWIGDQNGDGCDELLILQEPWIIGDVPQNPANRVELYLGDPDRISQEPAFIFEARDSLETMGLLVTYLGGLTARGAHDFAIWTARYWPEEGYGDRRIYYEINIYEGGEGRFDTVPDFVIRRYTDPNDRYGYGGVSLKNLGRPCDINGDGYDDLVAGIGEFDGSFRLGIFFGGADFDAVADAYLESGGELLTGDFNGDGNDDIIGYSYANRRINFFLGGDPPSGESVLTITQDQFEGYRFDTFRALPDVNDDGYDDWILGLWRPDNAYGFEAWLFFGGDTLDAEPDRNLEIDPTPIYGGKGYYGGDMNGDGRGDVLMGADYSCGVT